MGINVTCACGKRYSVADDKAGKKLQCQHCQAVMAIPAAGAASVTAPPPSAIPPPTIPPPPVQIPPVQVPPPAAEPQWFYTRAGQAVGPVGESMLRMMFHSGQVGSHELAWKQGDANSRPIGSVPQFSVSAASGFSAPNAAAGAPSQGLIIAGYLCSPFGIIGVLMGLYLYAFRKSNHGKYILIISGISTVLGLLMVAGG